MSKTTATASVVRSVKGEAKPVRHVEESQIANAGQNDNARPVLPLRDFRNMDHILNEGLAIFESLLRSGFFEEKLPGGRK